MGSPQRILFRVAALCAAAVLSFPSFAAGSSVGVDRTLGDLAGRMGMGALPPAEIPVTDGMVANYGPSPRSVRPIVDWVSRDGKQHNADGRRLTLPAIVAQGLGLGNAAVPIRQKAFGPEGRPDVTCTFQVAEDGSRAIIVARRENGRVLFWKLSDTGAVQAFLSIRPGDNPTFPPAESEKALLQDTLEFFFNNLPGSSSVD